MSSATDGPRHRRARRRLPGIVLLVLVVLAVLPVLGPAGVGRGAGSAGQPGGAASGDYVDPTRAAVRQVAEWSAQGRAADAALVRRMADEPAALWVVATGSSVRGQVADYVGRAVAAGQGPLLVLYGIPDRDCGGHSGGGAGDAAGYRRFVAEVVAGIGGRYATVVVEPDAVPHALTGCATGLDQRYSLLAGAVDALRLAGPVRVYLDAGNPGFVSDPRLLAAGLQRAGVDRADGFALNVANYYSTAENVRFGEQVSQELGGAHFVIDTSRNGNGPLAPTAASGIGPDGVPVWCNPPGRALGAPPTDRPGPHVVDAWLWVKNPGESDGRCRPGEPDAGAWYPADALELAGGSTIDDGSVK